MATVLDLGLLNYFSVLYPVIIVWCIIFAILQKTGALGKSIGINAVIAVAIAFMTLLSKTLVEMINFMVPWFAMAIIFFVLLILIFQMFGATEADFASAVKDKAVYWTLIGIALVILIAGFGKVMGQSFTEAAYQPATTSGVTTINGTTYTLPDQVSGTSNVASTNFEGSVNATLFHPKVLGLIILFAIAIFAVALLSGGT